MTPGEEKWEEWEEKLRSCGTSKRHRNWAKLKSRKIFEFAAIARFSIGLCVCWRSSKVTCYWSKLNQSISRRPGEVHRFTVFCWFKHGFAKSDSVTLRWFQYHLLSSNRSFHRWELAQWCPPFDMICGSRRPTIWDVKWLSFVAPLMQHLGKEL